MVLVQLGLHFSLTRHVDNIAGSSCLCLSISFLWFALYFRGLHAWCLSSSPCCPFCSSYTQTPWLRQIYANMIRWNSLKFPVSFYSIISFCNIHENQVKMLVTSFMAKSFVSHIKHLLPSLKTGHLFNEKHLFVLKGPFFHVHLCQSSTIRKKCECPNWAQLS